MNRILRSIFVLLLVVVSAGCTRIRGGGKDLEHSGTDFNLTITADELRDLKIPEKSSALAVMKRLHGLDVSRAVLTSDGFARELSDQEVERRNMAVTAISDVAPRILVVACVLNFGRLMYREYQRCRTDGVNVFALNFEASSYDLNNHENVTKLLLLFGLLNEAQSTVLLRGKLFIRIPYILSGAIQNAPRVTFILSDTNFLMQHDVILKLPNVYVELSDFFKPSSLNYKFEIHRMLRTYSAAKFIFGSGFTLRTGAHDPKAFEKLELPPSFLAAVKKNNAEKLEYLFSRKPIKKKEDP